MHDDLRRCLDEAFAGHARLRSLLAEEPGGVALENLQLRRTIAIIADERPKDRQSGPDPSTQRPSDA